MHTSLQRQSQWNIQHTFPTVSPFPGSVPLHPAVSDDSPPNFWVRVRMRATYLLVQTSALLHKRHIIPNSTREHAHIWGQLSSQKWYLCNTSVKKPARCTVSCSSEKCAFPCMWLQGSSFSEPCAVQCADVFYIQTSGACYASDPAWKCINPYFKTCTSVNSTVQVP